jgi:hypothetical protein
MSPKVRLPLVEAADQAKAEIAAVMAKLCDENPEYIIDGMCGPKHCNHQHRGVELHIEVAENRLQQISSSDDPLQDTV